MDIKVLKVYVVATIHLIMIIVNTISIPCLIIMEPFWIWMPLISFLVSPLLGGTYCIFNQLENHYRKEANMPEIEDRIDHVWKTLTEKYRSR